MATSFPGGLDSFTNPSGTDAMDSVTVPHATQHANLNDAVEAVQAKLGVGAGTIGTYVSYTPTFTNLTVGNGVINFTYSKINQFVHLHGILTFGSTTSITATPVMSLPVAKINIGLEAIGTGYLGDLGTATYMMFPLAISTTTVALFRADHTVGATVVEGGLSATSPFFWTTGDRINVNLSYEAA